MQWSLKALLRSVSTRPRTEHSQRTPGVMVSAGLCEKATLQLLRSTAAFTVAFWRTTTRQRCRSSQRQLCGKRTTHQATTVRPRGTGRRRTFSTPSLVGLHNLQTWPRWTTASGKPWSPRFQRSVFHRRLLSKAAIARAFAVVAASDVPERAVSAFKNRLQQCLDADGGHFEA